MRIAAVQTSPVYLDRAATIDVVVDRIAEAGAGGADLVAFPEVFVPGYPVWLDLTNAAAWEDPDQQETFARYVDQSVEVHGAEFAQVVDAVQEIGAFTYVGVVERAASGGSVYCSLVAIDPNAGIVSVHRKLKPTYGERLVWADGDGAGLVAHDHRGVRLTGLNCWENWMPLARSAMYATGSQVHVAAWPGSAGLTEDITRFIAKEACSSSAWAPCTARRIYRRTSRCGISCRQARSTRTVVRVSPAPTESGSSSLSGTSTASCGPTSMWVRWRGRDRISTPLATTAAPTCSRSRSTAPVSPRR